MSENFPRALRGEFVEGGKGRYYKLLEEFVYQDGSTLVVVPAGFVTDFSSVPRIFWRFLAPWEYPQAPVLHDYLYQNPRVSRAEADALYRRVLRLQGCGRLRAWGAWAALRLFGWAAWRNHRKADRARVEKLIALRLVAKRKVGKDVQ